MNPAGLFAAQGWLAFKPEASVEAWAASVLPAARRAVSDPANAPWLRCGRTWFVGVDALPNDASGRVNGGPPLDGAAMRFIVGFPEMRLPLHRAQLSVCYPGYPRPSAEETPAAYRYRLKRDAAHVDGLLAEGPARRRFLREPHAYVLGLPLVASHEKAAPLVVWSGSHLILRRCFREALAGQPASAWPSIDLTNTYQAARRQVFDSCQRVELPGKPGEAILLDRHLLHGVAPWSDGVPDLSGSGRMVAYFRPLLETTEDWRDMGP